MSNSSSACVLLPIAGDQFLAKVVREQRFLPTGCKQLDNLLSGGLLTGEVTELYGLPATGKTQTCMMVSAEVAARCRCPVLYLDTKGGFSAERIQELLPDRDMNPKYRREVLTRIHVTRLYDIFSVLKYLSYIDNSLRRREVAYLDGLRLVIVDSVTSLILSSLGGNQVQGQALMSKLGHVLRRLAVEHSLAILITNNAVKKFDLPHREQVYPALGRVWASVPHIRVKCMINDKDGVRTTVFCMVKCCR